MATHEEVSRAIAIALAAAGFDMKLMSDDQLKSATRAATDAANEITTLRLWDIDSRPLTEKFAGHHELASTKSSAS